MFSSRALSSKQEGSFKEKKKDHLGKKNGYIMCFQRSKELVIPYKEWLITSYLGVGNGQGDLVCCDSWGPKSWTRLSDWTELNWSVFELENDGNAWLYLPGIECSDTLVCPVLLLNFVLPGQCVPNLVSYFSRNPPPKLRQPAIWSAEFNDFISKWVTIESFLFIIIIIIFKFLCGPFQVALVVKNPPAKAGGLRDPGTISEPGRFPGGGYSNPLQYSCLEFPWTEKPGKLQSIASHRVRHWLKWFSRHTFLKSLLNLL